MSEAGKAVFLSYASQDAGAAKRIADALRAAGVEVWFDQNELVGGDAWDAKIRGQIGSCALFVPIISASTQARREGYFRIEWRLAAQRTHAMADDTPFLLPVVIDATRDADARVPAEFKGVQWTCLPGGEPPLAFAARVKQLLSTEIDEPVARLVSESNRRRPATPGRAARRARWLVPAGVAMGLVVAGALVWRLVPRAPSSPATVSGAFAAAEKSLAVLPFTNMSDDKDNAYFTDGMHEDILTDLANIPELRLVSRTSVQRYRGSSKSIREIAAELGVAYILEGSVRRSGNTVRVTGQLIRTATDEHVWAQHYDQELKDVFAIQASIAKEIARALQAAISPDQQARIDRVTTRVPAAYDLFLRARAIVTRKIEAGKSDYTQAESLLRAAIELDAGFAVAWAWLADVHALLYFHGIDQTDERRKLAQAAIEQAQRLAPDDAEVLRSIGAYYYHAWRDYPRAGGYYLRALALQPGDGDTHLLLGWLLRRQQKWPESRAAMLRAFTLDPSNIQARAGYVSGLVGARRYDEAERFAAPLILREKDPLSPLHFLPGLCRFYATGSLDEFAAALDRVPASLRQDPGYLSRQQRLAIYRGDWSAAARMDEKYDLLQEEPILRGALWLALGEAAKAQRALEPLVETRPKAPGTDLKQAAMAAALLRRKETALDLLQQVAAATSAANDPFQDSDFHMISAIVLAWTDDATGALRELELSFATPSHSPTIVHEVRQSPVWLPLREDPRFQALLNNPKNKEPLP